MTMIGQGVKGLDIIYGGYASGQYFLECNRRPSLNMQDISALTKRPMETWKDSLPTA